MLKRGDSSHLGVFYSNKIIHLNTHGAEYLEPQLAMRGFDKIRYYAISHFNH
jgi:hypothetical protein